MIKLFTRSSPIEKISAAVQSADLEKLLKILRKIEPSVLSDHDAEGLIELCIVQQQPQILEQLFRFGLRVQHTTLPTKELIALTLQQQDSLSLISTLLKNGLECIESDPLTLCCQHCSAEKRMLHISRFLQYGTPLDNRSDLIYLAVGLEDRPLLQFLISSGCPLPDTWQNGDSETIAYAQRCQQDYQLRQQFSVF